MQTLHLKITVEQIEKSREPSKRFAAFSISKIILTSNSSRKCKETIVLIIGEKNKCLPSININSAMLDGVRQNE